LNVLRPRQSCTRLATLDRHVGKQRELLEVFVGAVRVD
jgi:hypothetical protein